MVHHVPVRTIGTVKLLAEDPVPPAVVTDTVPDDAPLGTEVDIDVAVEAVTVDPTPPITTVLFAGVTSKPVPVMVTAVPTAPVLGLMPETVGAPTVKLLGDVTAPPAVVTDTDPVVAPLGTEVVIEVAVEVVTVAGFPLKVTVLFAGVTSKLVPVMVTDVPAIPVLELMLVTVGAPTVKMADVIEVPPAAVVTEIIPVVAPFGILTNRDVVVAAVIVAWVPLKPTVLLAGVKSNPLPEMDTAVPAIPVLGFVLVIAGTAASLRILLFNLSATYKFMPSVVID